jgi:predicted O-methyltransferase YrrM
MMGKKEFLAEFDQKYYPLLQGRAQSFRDVFEALGPEVTIVETGTLREPGNWAGDGQSTLLFDRYVTHCLGKVYSIDINPRNSEVAKPLVTFAVTFIVEDSLKFLPRLEEPIDLLYLDSLDGDMKGTAEHQLQEFLEAKKNLHSGSIVFIDDRSYKGRLLIPYIEGVLGWPSLTRGGIQDAWRVP